MNLAWWHSPRVLVLGGRRMAVSLDYKTKLHIKKEEKNTRRKRRKEWMTKDKRIILIREFHAKILCVGYLIL